jgi:hypothetical protein
MGQVLISPARIATLVYYNHNNREQTGTERQARATFSIISNPDDRSICLSVRAKKLSGVPPILMYRECPPLNLSTYFRTDLPCIKSVRKTSCITWAKTAGHGMCLHCMNKERSAKLYRRWLLPFSRARVVSTRIYSFPGLFDEGLRCRSVR